MLTLCCSEMAAPPLFWTEADGTRHGYEPDAAVAVAQASGLELRWIFRQWADFERALADGECDGIWCGSAITPERERRLLYTRPYAGAACVPFDGVNDDVFGDMLRALQIGEIDAVVDDDVAFIGIERTHPDIRVALTVRTRQVYEGSFANATSVRRTAT